MMSRRAFEFISLSTVLAIVFGLLFYVASSVFNLWSENKIEKVFNQEPLFGILLVNTSENSSKKKDVIFISVLIVNTELARIGFVSFLPETKLDPKSSSLKEHLLAGEFSHVQMLMSNLLALQVPFYILGSAPQVGKGIDILEGLPYFTWVEDIFENENIPKGSFLLSGDLAEELLEVRSKNKYFPIFQIYRHYSLFLNFWHHRKEKWSILQHQKLFGLIVNGLKTNLTGKDLYILASTFCNEEQWLPFFLEVPVVKKEKGTLLMNKEATALYYRNFKSELTEKEHTLFKTPPKVEVKNGTNIPKLAQKMRKTLSRKGFQVLEFSNADSQDYEHSVLLDISGKPFYLEGLSKALKIKRAYHAVNKTLFTDMILILGRDYSEISID